MRKLKNGINRIYRKPMYFICIAVVLIVLTCYILTTISSMVYSNCVKSQIRKKSSVNTEIINDRMNNCMSSLSILGSVFINPDGTINALKVNNLDNVSSAFFNKDMFCKIIIVDSSGMGYSGSQKTDVSKKSFYRQATGGNKYIEYNDNFLSTGPSFVFSVPVNVNGKCVGVACGIMKADSFATMINSSQSYDLNGSFLVDHNGVIVTDRQQNVFNLITKYCKNFKGDINEIQKNIYERKYAYITYDLEKTQKSAYFVPFDYNNWTVVTIDTNRSLSKPFIGMIAFATIGIELIFICVILLIIYRLYKKNCSAVIVNVSEQENEIVFAATQSIMFEYSFAQKTLKFSDYACQQFDFENEKLPLSSLFAEGDVLYEEHRKLLNDFFERINSGLRYNEAFCKFKVCGQIQYFLYKLTSTTIYDPQGLPFRAIGFINKTNTDGDDGEDIVVHDSLTGLFNRVALKNMINDYAKYNKDEEGALLIVDLKNFKSINEKLGYKAGDNVIISISEKLRQLFRSSDIIARTGDDEFTVFMKNVSSHELLEKRVISILLAVDNVIPKEKKIKANGNIGIALYPDDGADFNTLYANAKKALVEAKQATVPTYLYYSETSEE